MVPPLKRVSIKAPAKVNLYLKITGRREDGYHYLNTLMQKVSLFDLVEVEMTGQGIVVHCPGSDLPGDENNLAFRAARMFLETAGQKSGGRNEGVTVTLKKHIPAGAGLGGGSSDAGAVLRAMNFLCGNCRGEEELLELGASLGADVPFFIVDRPAAWATGVGDRLAPALPLSGYAIVLVNPGYSVATAWVYDKFALTAGRNVANFKGLQKTGSVYDFAREFMRRTIRPDELVNDLEQVTAGHYPEIELIKKRLLQGGAVAAMMSGSGPTVFGLFETGGEERAAKCAQELQREYPNTFLVEPLSA